MGSARSETLDDLVEQTSVVSICLSNKIGVEAYRVKAIEGHDKLRQQES